MDYILKGDPKEVAKVIRENRIRVQRGVISFTPVEPETVIEEVEEIETPDTLEDTPTNEETDTNTDSEPAEPMDDKNIEVEDVKEVDLDADDKTPGNDDTKDVQADDAKEATPIKKTTKRSKKSE